jgi:hypothetical protein
MREGCGRMSRSGVVFTFDESGFRFVDGHGGIQTRRTPEEEQEPGVSVRRDLRDIPKGKFSKKGYFDDLCKEVM